MDYLTLINNYFNSIKKTMELVDINKIAQFIFILKCAAENNRNIYVFGNGGSASTASHFACDFNKGLSNLGFKVESLCDNIATIMAISNDINYNEIFSEQLKNKIKVGDIAIGISGSGNSLNVIKGLNLANERGAYTIGITGFNGGDISRLVNLSINFPINDMQISEDFHLILNHMAMKILKQGGEINENIIN